LATLLAFICALRKDINPKRYMAYTGYSGIHGDTWGYINKITETVHKILETVRNITENVKCYPETIEIPENGNNIQCMGFIPGKGSF
jgi:hypothetical protein